VREADERVEAHRRARVLLDLGRVPEALSVVRRSLASNPNDPEGLEIEGLCLLRSRDYPEAMRVLARSIAERPEAAHPHYLYGFATRESGRLAEAVGPLETALRLCPDEPVYLRALAEIYAELGRHADALAVAQRAVALAPDRSANHVTLGYVASAAGNKDLARAQYRVAVKVDPSDSAAWNNLGCLELEAGKVLLARSRFREALRLDPRGERAQRNLSLILPPPNPHGATWEGVLHGLARELVRGRADKMVLAALLIEEPAAAQAFVRGGQRGTAFTGAATLLALRAMGSAALLPLSVGAAVAGAAYWLTRGPLSTRREQVRRVLGDGRVELERLRGLWLDGGLDRGSRDAAIELLIENMALTLVEGSCDIS
jgi:Flp pilus assembly protein TadD